MNQCSLLMCCAFCIGAHCGAGCHGGAWLHQGLFLMQHWICSVAKGSRGSRANWCLGSKVDCFGTQFAVGLDIGVVLCCVPCVSSFVLTFAFLQELCSPSQSHSYVISFILRVFFLHFVSPELFYNHLQMTHFAN